MINYSILITKKDLKRIAGMLFSFSEIKYIMNGRKKDLRVLMAGFNEMEKNETSKDFHLYPLL